MNIYVSNLGFTVQVEDLRKLFSPYGVIASVSLVLDKFTNRSRGFAFIEMPDTREAEKAISALNGIAVDGRTLNVNEAKQREDRRSRNSLY
jgi:RNA recognition motif-containing protein